MKKSKQPKVKKSNVEEIEKILKIERQPKNREEAIVINKSIVINKLIELGATVAEIDYNGSGDSGQVEEIRVLKNKKEVSLKDQHVSYYERQDQFNGSGWNSSFTKKTVSLEEALEKIAEDLLDYNGIDWYNNDGGYGIVRVDLKDQKLKLEHNQRIMSEQYEEHEL